MGKLQTLAEFSDPDFSSNCFCDLQGTRRYELPVNKEPISKMDQAEVRYWLAYLALGRLYNASK